MSPPYRTEKCTLKRESQKMYCLMLNASVGLMLFRCVKRSLASYEAKDALNLLASYLHTMHSVIVFKGFYLRVNCVFFLLLYYYRVTNAVVCVRTIRTESTT